jgi:hypothetical protein
MAMGSLLWVARSTHAWGDARDGSRDPTSTTESIGVLNPGDVVMVMETPKDDCSVKGYVCVLTKFGVGFVWPDVLRDL